MIPTTPCMADSSDCVRIMIMGAQSDASWGGLSDAGAPWDPKGFTWGSTGIPMELTCVTNKTEQEC